MSNEKKGLSDEQKKQLISLVVDMSSADVDSLGQVLVNIASSRSEEVHGLRGFPPDPYAGEPFPHDLPSMSYVAPLPKSPSDEVMTQYTDVLKKLVEAQTVKASQTSLEADSATLCNLLEAKKQMVEQNSAEYAVPLGRVQAIIVDVIDCMRIKSRDLKMALPPPTGG